MTDPAIVTGNEQRAVAYFIEAENGDLVDIEYVCCEETPGDALQWPAYQFSTDYDTCCARCGMLIHEPARNAGDF